MNIVKEIYNKYFISLEKLSTKMDDKELNEIFINKVENKYKEMNSKLEKSYNEFISYILNVDKSLDDSTIIEKYLKIKTNFIDKYKEHMLDNFELEYQRGNMFLKKYNIDNYTYILKQKQYILKEFNNDPKTQFIYIKNLISASENGFWRNPLIDYEVINKIKIYTNFLYEKKSLDYNDIKSLNLFEKELNNDYYKLFEKFEISKIRNDDKWSILRKYENLSNDFLINILKDLKIKDLKDVKSLKEILVKLDRSDLIDTINLDQLETSFKNHNKLLGATALTLLLALNNSSKEKDSSLLNDLVGIGTDVVIGASVGKGIEELF